MASFGTVQLPNFSAPNQLLDLASVDHDRLVNDTAAQDLADRGTLRGLVPGLAIRDQNALAGAAVLGQPGTAAVGALNNNDLSRLQLLQYGDSIPQMAPVTGQGGAPGGGISSMGPAGAAPGVDGFAAQLGGTESAGGPGVVNKQGFAGQFQFGAPRLADLGLYTPAPGEIGPNGHWNGQMNGQFTIPGFPDVKTKADFLASPNAQRAAFGQHIDDIDHTISQTPGADQLNQNGLRAVAHLGGTGGMQRFVATGGQYNPGDSNGTRLSDYYQKFAQGGVPALRAAFGHPEGRLPPSQQVASASATAGMPVVANDASPSPDQVLDGTMQRLRAGQGAPAPGDVAQPPAAQTPPAPALNNVNDPQVPFQPGQGSPPGTPAGARTIDGGPHIPYTGGVPDANRNPLFAPGSPSSPIPQNTLLAGNAPPPATPAPPQPNPVDAAMIPPGANTSLPPRMLMIGPGHSLPATTGAPPGTARAVYADQQGNYTIPGFTRLAVPPSIKSTPVGGFMINTDERTGQEVSRFSIPEQGRGTMVQVPGGNQMYINGHPTGPVIPFSGRDAQMDAYKSDIPVAQGFVQANQGAQQQALRLNEMADILQGLKTGPTGESRAKAQAYLEAVGVDPAAAAGITGMSSAAAAQLFQKLALTTAGGAAKADVGANNGIQSIEAYRAANPNLDLMPDANKRVTNMLRVANQSTQDYAQGGIAEFQKNEAQMLGNNPQSQGSGNYRPLSAYNVQWAQQNNPQVYAGAMGILNGDKFENWSARLSPEQGRMAAQIAARIDPNAMVPGRGGGMIPASRLVQAR